MFDRAASLDCALSTPVAMLTPMLPLVPVSALAADACRHIRGRFGIDVLGDAAVDRHRTRVVGVVMLPMHGVAAFREGVVRPAAVAMAGIRGRARAAGCHSRRMPRRSLLLPPRSQPPKLSDAWVFSAAAKPAATPPTITPVAAADPAIKPAARKPFARGMRVRVVVALRRPQRQPAAKPPPATKPPLDELVDVWVLVFLYA